MTESEELIDVRRLIDASSVTELNRLAEEYFAREKDWTYYLAKPFGAIDETPQLLINFAVVLQGLSLYRGVTVLEFGAGTCWAARFLTQLDCKVIAMDISPTALRIGKELYRRHPVFGSRPEPQFLEFDGHHIDLADKTVDRVMCLDAFHHVPNPREVLLELGRVLKDGGIAAFAEPGPEHSRSPQSQYEMRTFKVVENDIDIAQVREYAGAAGFTDLKLAVFNVPAFHLSANEFEDFLNGLGPSQTYAEATAAYMTNQRTFFLHKGEIAKSDSRYRAGLTAKIDIEPNKVTVRTGERIVLKATIKNDSSSTWLPRSAGVGGVQLGCHVYDPDGSILHHSYHWEPLTPGDGTPIMPSETVAIEASIPPLPLGSYILEFDMVSNDVSWFARNGSPTVKVSVNVV
jgi:ubiquinone/menaquinone biosynthesis C-methylase UbiE